MTKIQAFTLLAIAAVASAATGSACAETTVVGPAAALARKDIDSGAPAVVKAKAGRDAKAPRSTFEGGRRNVASSTAKEGGNDPYTVPLFKDARQLR